MAFPAPEFEQHPHSFLGQRHERNEHKTRLVIYITFTVMLAEIIGGICFGSMALIADGWHMSTHVGALAISAFAYMLARRHHSNPRFSFGTGKFGDLAGFASALILAIVALIVIYQALNRLFHPIPIAFGEAISVALLGLCVNALSVYLMHDHGEHSHEGDDCSHHAAHHDLNFRSAYMHILADTASSLLAIAGLGTGWAFGWIWMDAIMGILGSFIILNWSYTLLRDASRVLLDVTPDDRLFTTIKNRIEEVGGVITDLHLWQIGPGHYGAIVALISTQGVSPNIYKDRLSDLKRLSHITIEINTEI